MSDNFLSRWSRRKLEARNAVADTRQLDTTDAVKVADQDPQLASLLPASGHLQDQAAGTDTERTLEQAPLLALPTEADLQAVQQGGDIKAFMVDKVSRELKNKAFKALFSRPEFNVMDGLDIYIDDYNKFTPLSADDISKMTFSKQLLSRPDLDLPKVDDVQDAVEKLVPVSEEVASVSESVIDKQPSETENPLSLGGSVEASRVNPDALQVADSEQISPEQSFKKPRPD